MSNDRSADSTAVSLFTNCGAGDVGYARSGFNFVVMADIDERRLTVAGQNHAGAALVAGDLRVTLPLVVDRYRERVGSRRPALLAACPPCQGMSSAQSLRGLARDADAGSKDPRNLLVEVIAEAAASLSPRVVVVENVQAFLSRKVRHPVSKLPISGANYLINELSSEYAAFPMTSDLSSFGVPQSRKRSFLTFVRSDEPGLEMLAQRRWVPYPWPSHGNSAQAVVTLRQALTSFSLPSLDASDERSATSDDPMHSVPIWPRERYRMISAIPEYSGRSAWENSECVECGHTTSDPTAIACGTCGRKLLRPITTRDNTDYLVRGFHTSYRRMSPDEPAATITTASGHVSSDRTIHPWEHRVLSPRECALLQTFPPTFKWGEALQRWGHTNVRTMIGEAVPPLFTYKHGRVLRGLLRNTPPRLAMGEDDRRVVNALRALSGVRT